MLPLLGFLGGRTSGSPSEPAPYEDMVHDMARPAPRGGSGGDGGRGGEYRTSRTRAPGDREVHDDDAEELPAEAPAKRAHTAEDIADEESAGLQPDELAVLNKTLEEKRSHWHHEMGDQPTHFAMSIRGGKWTAEKKGVGADVAAAWAVGDDAESWCKVLFGVKMASFSLKLYTEPVAGHLAMYGPAAWNTFTTTTWQAISMTMGSCHRACSQVCRMATK